jgi:cell wall-associated NlpC family hydrolase
MPVRPTPRPNVAIALSAVSLLTLVVVCSPVRAQDGASALAETADKAKAVASSALEGAQSLGTFALSLIGVDYRWGGTRPETGLDCSGLVQYVFQQVTGITLPRTAQQMSRMGERVKLSELEPGDLVFFNTRRFAFSHVGIYLGDNRFIHAPARGREVEIATIDAGYWQKRFNGARRLAGFFPVLLAPLVSDAVAAPQRPPVEPEPEAIDP